MARLGKGSIAVRDAGPAGGSTDLRAGLARLGAAGQGLAWRGVAWVVSKYGTPVPLVGLRTYEQAWHGRAWRGRARRGLGCIEVQITNEVKCEISNGF
jgi:hypothetical protein